MTPITKENTVLYTVDAEGKKLGRVASEIATFLMGKNKATFKRNTPAAVKVEVVNAAKLFLDQKKLRTKEYVRYTGYPGGLKKESLGHLVKRRGYKEAIRNAVYGMLPSNKLRVIRMKNLSISD
ncbi:MAG: 50S ribosomal protein L13 [Parcubacteria group bacterium]|nr:50S ribosomal protein L13 [Parcubacteria group bacterium]